jgi:cytochrome P450
MDEGDVDETIVTPRGRAGIVARLGREQFLPALAARLAVRTLRRPLRLGSRVFAARHDQVRELLSRDLDFGIAAINEAKIREVNGGAFVLGMDRSERLEVERRALYAALEAVDMDHLAACAAAEIETALSRVPAGGEIDVVGAFARPVAAHTAQRLFGITGPNDRMFMEVVRSVFAHTFLNLADDAAVRERAVRAGRHMGRWFADEIARRRASGVPGDDMMGQLLRQGLLDDDGVRRTLGGMLVGSIDTTASAVARIVKVAARDPDLLFAMSRDARDLRRMDGWCNEALRRWPHNPIVMRKARADTSLAGTAVKAGDTMIAWTQAAMQDESVFPDAARLDPERDRAAYLHLGWGLHPCSGRPVNRFQIPMLVGALLARGLDRAGRVAWAGPFPNRLDVRLREGPPLMDALLTIVAPIRKGRLPAVEAQLDALGNPPAERIAAALDAAIDEDGGATHFMSIHAIGHGSEGDASIVLELTADGSPDRAVERMVQAVGADLAPIFECAFDWRGDIGLLAYLKAHRIRTGWGLFSRNPGLGHAGTPGMSVGRIRKEAALADYAARALDEGGCDVRPIDRLAAVRRAVGASAEHRWALEPPPPPPRGEQPVDFIRLAASFASTYLWPLGLLLAAMFAAVWIVSGEFGDALEAAVKALGVLAVALLLFAGWAYATLRRLEKSDWTDERAADAQVLAEMRRRENHGAQNHMVSVTERKPGLVRWMTLRLIFWVIAQLATRSYRPGFLGGISTIHAARWITIPGTRHLVFFSNFGGSWESYLEDFITRAHAGLTGVWSNSIGFPRSKNLVHDGATDGERFKRYARRSMMPTRFWYSAYPSLTTDHVRCNAALRRGLAGALTNDEAEQWLALFGSGPRPDSKLETSEIQCLAFGGLGFMKEGSVVLYRLPEDRDHARAFVAGLYPHVGFGDGRKLRHDAVVTLALGPGALERLGLPEECLKGFAAAFLEGMGTEARNRILGDIGRNAPENWLWGRDPYDLALLVYGRSEEAVAELCAHIHALAGSSGLAEPHRIPLAPAMKPAIEPFGFVDGVSQPIIRGSYQSYRKNDPIHLVEPGEFIIGYPDNRGNFPPEPELSALSDPGNRLAVADRSRDFGNSIVDAPRAVGRNGSYLVLRQLEQDVTGFWRYCSEEAARLEGRLPAPYEVTPHYIAAKLVGRWPDGSSLVRNPYYPFPIEHEKRATRRENRETAEGFTEQTAIAASGEPIGSETVRPDGNPGEASPIAAASQSGAAAAAAPAPAPAAGRNAAPRDDPGPLQRQRLPVRDRGPDGDALSVRRPYPPVEPARQPRARIDGAGLHLEPPPHPARRPSLRAAGRARSGPHVHVPQRRHRTQFEFIQQTWLVSPAFHGLVGEQDPLTSNCDGTGFVIPSHDGPVRLKPLPQFVRTLGGGYFFMPGRSLLAWLAGV